MALVKETMKKSIEQGFIDLWNAQSDKAIQDGAESQDPKEVIKQIAGDMANIIANAVDSYVRSGEIIVGPTNIGVTCASPGSPGVVAPIQPAKMT